MASNARAFAEFGLGELLEIETSVLQTLCLTVNTAGSEIKYKILDVLSGVFDIEANEVELGIDAGESLRVGTGGTFRASATSRQLASPP